METKIKNPNTQPARIYDAYKVAEKMRTVISLKMDCVYEYLAEARPDIASCWFKDISQWSNVLVNMVYMHTGKKYSASRLMHFLPL